jgi:hypothetical protein
MGQCKSALRTLYIGFRKAKLKRTYDSPSQGAKDFERDYAEEQLRENVEVKRSKKQ